MTTIQKSQQRLSTLLTCAENTAYLAINTAFGAAVGYLCTRVCVALSPLHGSVFGATSSFISTILEPVVNRCFNSMKIPCSVPYIKSAVSTLFSAAMTAAAATLLGFPISAGMVLSFTLLTTALKIIFDLGVILSAYILAR
jgi:hypothetical protein